MILSNIYNRELCNYGYREKAIFYTICFNINHLRLYHEDFQAIKMQSTEVLQIKFGMSKKPLFLERKQFFVSKYILPENILWIILMKEKQVIQKS